MKISAIDDTYKVWTDKDLLLISRPSVKLVLKRKTVSEFNQRDLRKCMKFIKYISDYDIDMYLYSLQMLTDCIYEYGGYTAASVKRIKIIEKEIKKYEL